jgi:hypothetical protein
MGDRDYTHKEMSIKLAKPFTFQISFRAKLLSLGWTCVIWACVEVTGFLVICKMQLLYFLLKL